MSPMSMTIFTSCGPRVSSCWRSLAPISTSSVRATSVSGELRSSSSGVGFGTAAAMTTSAQVSRAMSTGTLRVRPPSPRIRPSIVTGANTPGTAMLARIARARSPLDEHHHLAALHVGRDGPERDRQLVEVRDVAAAGDEVLDGEVDVLGAEEPARRGERAVAHAELEAVGVGAAGELAAHRDLVAQPAAGDRLLPRNGADGFFDLACRAARGEGAPDQGTHARADDAVDRDVQFFERGEHADVGRALGAAAAEHQPDARPMHAVPWPRHPRRAATLRDRLRRLEWLQAVSRRSATRCSRPGSASTGHGGSSCRRCYRNRADPTPFRRGARGRDDRRALLGPFTASAPAA